MNEETTTIEHPDTRSKRVTEKEKQQKSGKEIKSQETATDDPSLVVVTNALPDAFRKLGPAIK